MTGEGIVTISGHKKSPISDVIEPGVPTLLKGAARADALQYAYVACPSVLHVSPHLAMRMVL